MTRSRQLLPVSLMIAILAVVNICAGDETFPAATIKQLRQKASDVTQVPENIPQGWTKSRINPAKLLDIYKPLHLRKGFVLRAYQYRSDVNGNGIVWALPDTADFPEPKDCPTLANHLLSAPKPADALDDVMEAVEGDGLAWSYLAASMLRREFSGFGAMGHGMSWGLHTVLGEDPWKAGPPKENEFPIDRPTGRADQFTWKEPKPTDWNPQVHIEDDQITVTFYTYSGYETQTIYRHTDTYRPGKYRPRVEEKPVAIGPPGFLP